MAYSDPKQPFALHVAPGLLSHHCRTRRELMPVNDSKDGSSAESDLAKYRRATMWVKLRIMVWLPYSIFTVVLFKQYQANGQPGLALLVGLPFCVYTLFVVVTSFPDCPRCAESVTARFLNRDMPNPWASRCPSCGMALR